MDFEKERANLIAQRDNAYAAYQQAIGALAMLDAVAASMAPPEGLTVESIQEALDTGSATIEPL